MTQYTPSTNKKSLLMEIEMIEETDTDGQRRAIDKMWKMKTEEIKALTIDQVKELGKG